MTPIKGIIQHGQVVLPRPAELADGTEVNVVPIPNPSEKLGIGEEEWSDTPEAIEAWIRWYDSLEPLEFTPEERADWDAARREQKQFELAQWEQRSKRIEGLFS